jgi:uncharacterized protein (UPF0548 family)
VFGLRRPSADRIAQCLRVGATAPWSYPEVAATLGGRAALPSAVVQRYDVDLNAQVLGRGRALFEHASAALLRWRGFEIPWLELHGAATPVAQGVVVATLVHTLGVWTLNPCRVVYVIGGPNDPDRVGFAYGTIAGHAERGEERFLVEHDRTSDEVRFEILAFSRPGHPLVRVGAWHARALQRRFARDALAALARAAG